MKAIKLITFFMIFFGGTANGQIALSETMDMVNYRFADSQSRAYVDQHPSLTFNGFKSSNDNFGYSIESIINKIYYSSNTSDQKLIRDLFEDIVDDAKLSLVVDPSVSEECPLDRDQVEENSRMLQNLAFVALISYVANKEGINVQSPPNGAAALLAPTQAMSNLKTAFTRMLGYGVFGMTCGDEVHRAQSIANTAKAIDLYLALENAYKHYENPSSWNYSYPYFLSSSQKAQLMSFFKQSIDLMYLHLKEGALGISTDEAEPGNRPLIIYTSIAYSTLVLQSSNQLIGVDAGNFSISINNLIEEALERSNKSAGTNSIYYWGYQTADGESFWAEGQYYFKLSLRNVISLWHAKRINNISTNFTYVDPFLSSNSMARKPLIWLAQTYEPGGFSAPIDDGNKSTITASSFLRWSSDYGNEEIGKRFSHIASEIRSSDEGIGLNTNMRVFELAVPRTLPTTPTLPDKTWGNTSPGIPSQNGNHEIVFRYTDNSGREHFVYLNGEVGDAITRGEGHEQPDQLQLLYSVDEHSYLVDSGYNYADGNGGFINVITGNDYNRSNWNNYKDHNVMQFYSTYQPFENIFPDPHRNFLGGIDHPEREGTIPRVQSDHQSVSELYFDDSTPNVNVAYGRIPLISFNLDGSWGVWVDYRRKVLMIKDPNAPYLIDINMGNTTGNGRGIFLTTYHGNSNSLPRNLENTNDHAVWTDIDGSIDKHLLLYANAVEGTLFYNTDDNSTYYSDTAREKFGPTKDIKRLNLYASDEILAYHTRMSTKVSFVKPIIGVSSSALLSDPDLLKRPTPYYEQELDEELKEQAYIWDIDSNTKDVLIARGAQHYKGESTSNISITVESTELRLAANKDFGFVRLKKQNGLWKIDNNYKVNISQPGYFYTSNHTVGNYTYPTGTNIYVADNVTLTFSGTVNLNNVEVFLGKDAKIKVNNSGKIIAEDTDFKRLNANEEYEGVVVLSDWNEFKYCTFQGGDKALNFYTSNYNIIRNSNFIDNKYGLYLHMSDALVIGGEFSENEDYGILLLQSELGIEEATNGVGTKVANNGINGIGLLFYSSAWIQKATFRSASNYSVKLDNNSRAYIGEGVNATPSPWRGGQITTEANNFYNEEPTSKYVYNMAMTNTGETSTNWIVPARRNYWEDAYQSSAFHGPVDHGNPNPNPYGYLSKSTTHGLSADANSPQPVMSASKAKNVTKDAEGKNEQQKLLEIQKKLNEINTWMRDKPLDPENGRWLRSYVGLLRFAGEAGFKTERQALRGHNNKWLARFHSLNSLQADTLRELEQHAALQMNDMANTNRRLDTGAEHRLNKFVTTSNTVGEVAVLMELEEALNRQKYDRVVKLYDKYAPVIKNTDNQYGILSALLLAHEASGEYGAALGVVEELESLKPDKAMAEGYEAPDFTEIKAMLADSAIANDQSIQFAKAKPGKVAAQEELPSEFRLASPYPNPFNPTTTIGFELPETGEVRIEVFNITGQLVSVLTNKRWQAGRHQLTFNADGLASGVYLVRIQYAGITESQKITLVK